MTCRNMALFVLSIAAGCALCVRAGENLLGDPGFEAEKDSPWIFNNWWTGDLGQTNDAEFVRDAANPRSGDACLRMGLIGKRGGNLQLTHPLTRQLGGGEAVQVRFWVRGPSNSHPLSLIFDKDAPPWTEYYRANVPLTEEWREHVFNLTFPERIDTQHVRLMFLMEEENTVWLDDVSLCRLPDEEGGEPLSGNRVANGSFETGRNRWYAQFQESGRTPSTPRAVELNIKAELASVAAVNAPAGRRVLRMKFQRGCGVHLTSALFRLRYGHPADISFHARCEEGGGRLRVSLAHGEFPNITSVSEEFEIGREWKPFAFRAVPSASTGGKYYVQFTSYAGGTYELDDVRVSEPAAPENPPGVELGWTAAADTPPGHVFYRDEKPEFQVNACAPGKTGRLAVRARVLDVWENEVERMSLDMALDDEGYGQCSFAPPVGTYGAFKCEFRAAEENESAGGLPLLELVYHVVPRLTPLKDVEDSYFGGHFDMTPYNLGIAERGGYRWLRLHPPMNTKWEVVEPRPDTFQFHLAGIRRAHAMGFKILGSFQATPDAYADAPKGVQNEWWDNWAPKEEHMDAYERYVSKTTEAFGAYIRHWEIWNEPDICFFNVPPGRDRAKAYLEISRRTRKVFDRPGMEDCVLVGGAVTDNDRPFTMEILEQGMGGMVDAFSFHHYSPGLDALLRRQDRIGQWRAFANRADRPMPIWQTESGIYTGAGATWLTTCGRPVEPHHAMHIAAARTVQNLVFFKAIGVEKFFTYALQAHPAGRTISRNDWQSVIDVNGIPYSPLPAHAAAVYFLEGTEPVGLKTPLVDGARIFIAEFSKQGRPVTVAWSSKPAALADVKELRSEDRRIFDMMGNAVEAPAALTPDPLYFISD